MAESKGVKIQRSITPKGSSQPGKAQGSVQPTGSGGSGTKSGGSGGKK